MNLSFWTITMWKDEQSMKIYRNSGAHLKAMPKLLNWSNEASVVSWTQQEEGFPTWKEAYNQLQERGRLSKVNNPSENHISKRIKEPVSTKFENLLYPPKSND